MEILIAYRLIDVACFRKLTTNRKVYSETMTMTQCFRKMNHQTNLYYPKKLFDTKVEISPSYSHGQNEQLIGLR